MAVTIRVKARRHSSPLLEKWLVPDFGARESCVFTDSALIFAKSISRSVFLEQLPEFRRARDAVKNRIMRTALGAQTTTDAPGAALQDIGAAEDVAFVASLRGQSAFMRILADGGFRQRPFRRRTTVSTANLTASLRFADALPVALQRLGAADVTLNPLNAGALLVMSAELFGASSDAMHQMARQELEGAVGAVADIEWIAGLVDSSLGGGPASGDVFADLRGLLADVAVVADQGQKLYWIAAPDVARRLATLTGPDSEMLLFPELHPSRGGPLLNIQLLPAPLAAGQLALLDASSFAANAEGFDFAVSTQSAIEMQTAPVQDGSRGVGVSAVSLYQTQGVALKMTWRWACQRLPGRDAALALLTGCNW